MEENSTEKTVLYISRDEAINLIKDYAERRVDQSKCSPAWTASQIATLLFRLPTKETGFIQFGSIETHFKGINLSMGRCRNCGKKLVWYTEQPLNGCPYCHARRRKEVTPSGTNHDIVRNVPKGTDRQPVQSEAGRANHDGNAKETSV